MKFPPLKSFNSLPQEESKFQSNTPSNFLNLEAQNQILLELVKEKDIQLQSQSIEIKVLKKCVIDAGQREEKLKAKLKKYHEMCNFKELSNINSIISTDEMEVELLGFYERLRNLQCI